MLISLKCLEFRALNPEKPLPEIEAHLEALVNPPPEVSSVLSVSTILNSFLCKNVVIK